MVHLDIKGGLDRRKANRVRKALKTELEENGGIGKLVNIAQFTGGSVEHIEIDNFPEIRFKLLEANLDMIGLLD